MKKLMTPTLIALATLALTAQATPVNSADATASYAILAASAASNDATTPQNPNQDLAQTDDNDQPADNSDDNASNSDLSANDADSGAADDSDTN